MSTSRKKEPRSKVSEGELNRLLLSSSMYSESKAVKKMSFKRERENGADINDAMVMPPQPVTTELPPVVAPVTNRHVVADAVSPLMMLADAIDVRLDAEREMFVAYQAEYDQDQAKVKREALVLDDIEQERSAMLAAPEFVAEVALREQDSKKIKFDKPLFFSLYSSNLFTTIPITNPVLSVNSPLHQAIIEKNHNDLSVLIQECRKKNVNVDNFNGMNVTPLWLAVKLGNVMAVELLLNANADSTKGQYGSRTTPFSLLNVEHQTKNRNVIFELMYEQQLRIYRESLAAVNGKIVILVPQFDIPDMPARLNGFRY